MKRISIFHQFHVRELAVKTGGFHCKRSGSIRRLPFNRSFSRCFSRCSSTVFVRTMICVPLYEKGEGMIEEKKVSL